jgi:hypothetical protein
MEGKTGDELVEAFCQGDLEMNGECTKAFNTEFKRHEGYSISL